MIIEENWAIEPKRVRAFFTEQPDSVEIPEGFSVGGCTVTLTETGGSPAVSLSHAEQPKNKMK